MWPFKPNWANGVDVQLGYRTDINTSRSGREQRRALRGKPRRQISYTISVDGAERQQFVRLLSKWQGRPMLLGDPTRKVILPNGIPANASSAAVSQVPEWLVVGRQILLADTTVVTVTAIDGVSVTFEPDNPAILPPGSTLRPAMTGLLTGGVSASHPVSRVASARINFAVDPGSEPAEAGSPGIYIHGGREVFMLRPNWAEVVDQNFEFPVEQVDYGHGRIRTFQPIEQGWFTQAASFVGVGADEVSAIETLFHRMRGRRGEFLMPTGTDDLVIREGVTAGTTVLRVAATDILHQSIMVRLRDGRVMLRTIDSTETDGDDAIQELTSPWFYDFEVADVAMISWLPVFRFASDDLTFEWPASHVARVKLTMRSLEDLAAERPITDMDGAAQWVLEYGGESLAGLDLLDYAVNVRYPEIFD